jgi:hypothetical protein
MEYRDTFQITASCRFWWSDNFGEMSFAAGWTRNLGSGAVCIVAEVLPFIGAIMMLEIDLPRNNDQYGPTKQDLLFLAEGIVCEHHASQGEFVVTINYASIDNPSLIDEIERLEGHSDAPS